MIVEFGKEIDDRTHLNVKAFTKQLESNPFPGFIEVVPAFCSVTVYYDPSKVKRGLYKPNKSAIETVYVELEKGILQLNTSSSFDSRECTIPVLYGGKWGPDLEVVARHNNLTTDEVIYIHSNAEYVVYMIGFAPGFPYLGGMPEEIATPRKEKPRLVIPAGSVGIAGKQTGIYPISTPGGWQLIGRTPLELFLPSQNPPSLLQAGDRIRFKPISAEEYKERKEKWK